MTSHAVLSSLRTIRFNRLLFNGRRWRFLDSVAYFSGRPSPRCDVASRPAARCFKALCGERTYKTTEDFLSSKSTVTTEAEYSVDVSSKGTPLNRAQLVPIAIALQDDAVKIMQELIQWHQSHQRRYVDKESIELSLILSDDANIRRLNQTYLKVDSPTDVLSFPLDGEEDDHLPVMLLGDVVLSLDTAERQAKEMGHDLLTECRILLVHAILHLLGYDHDRSEEAWNDMAKMERRTLSNLGWKGQGLISSAKRLMLRPDIEPPVTSTSGREAKVRNATSFPLGAALPESPTLHGPDSKRDIQLVAVDMDGTLLTSDLEIRDSSRVVIHEALRRGVSVIVATGKARPGAIAACEKFGLYGKNNLISHDSAGIFLQGLVVHTLSGEPLHGVSLSVDVVRSVFNYASRTATSCVAFTGDETVTLLRTPDVIELHEKFYEPLAEEVGSVEEILRGPPVKKIVLLSDPESIDSEIQPHWDRVLTETATETTRAVASMLEVIPKGTDKWVGLSALMQSMNVRAESCVAIGDGRNDYQMIKNAALGVAMGNAVDEVKAVADLVVSSHDEDGIAEAFEKLIL